MWGGGGVSFCTWASVAETKKHKKMDEIEKRILRVNSQQK